MAALARPPSAGAKPPSRNAQTILRLRNPLDRPRHPLSLSPVPRHGGDGVSAADRMAEDDAAFAQAVESAAGDSARGMAAWADSR
eukprot:11083959-Alexandrium_andersonii.AAC.1